MTDPTPPSLPIDRRHALALLAAGMSPLFGCAAAPVPVPRVKTHFGLNVCDLLNGGFKPGGSFGTATLKTLGQRGIPFVRFAASGQWAADWARFEADPARHWAALDTIFAAAEQNGVKLVPTVLWHTVALAFHCGESMQAWTDPASRTRQLAHSYTDSFAQRYDRSPALLMYEFTNELNDWIDLPNVLKFWPVRDPTMPARTGTDKDRLTGVQMHDFVQDFARTIRARSRRPIGAGTDLPRANAWHLAHSGADKDTPDQFAAQLRALTPPEVNVLSIHLYEGKYGKRDSPFATLADTLQAFVQTAALDGRIAFLGEFGVPRSTTPADERRRLATMIDTIARSNVPYAALWNYSDRPFQRQWDVAATGDRAYQLDAVVQANK